MKKKYYLFRESGQDEGFVALLTAPEYRQIQSWLGKLAGDDDPPFYIYPVYGSTFKGINKTLDGYLEDTE